MSRWTQRTRIENDYLYIRLQTGILETKRKKGERFWILRRMSLIRIGSSSMAKIGRNNFAAPRQGSLFSDLNHVASEENGRQLDSCQTSDNLTVRQLLWLTSPGLRVDAAGQVQLNAEGAGCSKSEELLRHHTLSIFSKNTSLSPNIKPRVKAKTGTSDSQPPLRYLISDSF